MSGTEAVGVAAAADDDAANGFWFAPAGKAGCVFFAISGELDRRGALWFGVEAGLHELEVRGAGGRFFKRIGRVAPLELGGFGMGRGAKCESKCGTQ